MSFKLGPTMISRDTLLDLVNKKFIWITELEQSIIEDEKLRLSKEKKFSLLKFRYVPVLHENMSNHDVMSIVRSTFAYRTTNVRACRVYATLLPIVRMLSNDHQDYYPIDSQTLEFLR